MKAFHNSQELKDRYTARVQLHAQRDEIIQGQYWQEGKGCLWGCTLHSQKPHLIVEEVLGIPRIISRLSDQVFEGLSNKEAKVFPLQFHQAIPVGADLSNVWNHFAIFLMKGLEECSTGAAVVKALYERRLGGDEPTIKEWRSAADAADAYAAAYAASAAYADAAYVAAAYAAAAAYAYAAAAAYAAADAAAADAADAYDAAAADAKQLTHSRQRDKLLELLKAAPVT